MYNTAFSRRNLLKLLGLSTAGLALTPMNKALAGETVPRRIIIVTSPHGQVYDNWTLWNLFGGSPDVLSASDWDTPLADRTLDDFSPILKPFFPLREKATFLDGVVNASAICDAAGNNHGVGGFHSITGANVLQEGEDASSLPWQGMSVDQVIADRVTIPGSFRSLHFSNQGRSNGSQTGGSFSRSRGAVMIPEEGNLTEAWNRMFGVQTSDNPVTEQLYNGRRSVLDFLGDRFESRVKEVSTLDRQKLEMHQSLVRDLELRIEAMENRVCDPPEVDSMGLPPEFNETSHFREVGQIQAKLIRAAFACDLTRVVRINLSNGQRTGDFIGAPGKEIHSDLAHSAKEDAFAKERMTEFGRYNAQIVADLAAELDTMTEADGSTMLDNTLILWTGDIANGSHDFGPMPYVLLGGGNGMVNAGRYVHYGTQVRLPGNRTMNRSGAGIDTSTSMVGAAHNRLLVGLCHGMGLTDVDWVGQRMLLDELDVSGPLRNLL